MFDSAAKRLLTRLDPLDFPARMRLLATEALRLADEGGLDTVRLLGTAGAKLGWPGPFRLAVKALRHHRDPEVAEAALDVNTGSA